MMERQTISIFLLALAALAAGGCQAENSLGEASQRTTPPTSTAQPTQQMPPASPERQSVPVHSYEVVNAWPHDKTAFTQGLIFHEDVFLESTGQYGASTLRRVEPKTGRVLQEAKLARQYFAEGMTLFQGKIYQLTWTTRRGFIYDPTSFQVQGEFSYDGEGWGLTHDAQSLILSDGTNQIRFLDPSNFQITKTIRVFDEQGRPLRELNELEYVKGEIYANVWHTDRIARIDPGTGRLLGWIDLTGLLADTERSTEEAVLNGIAYDEAGDRLFVTGKLWPKLFEVRLKSKG